MGRLVDALRRLEADRPAMPTADMAVEADSRAESDSHAQQTAVLEPPADRKEEFSSPESSEENESLKIADYRTGEENETEIVAEAAPADIASPAETASEYDPYSKYFESESPLRDEAAMTATFDAAASAIETAEETPDASIDQVFSKNTPLDLHSGKPSRPIPLFVGDKTVARPESRSNVAKEAGVFRAMARKILTQLPGDGPAAMFLTSPTDGEGKTETILPLAEALVEESGRRAILVDANLRRPDLTREWRFSSRRGIFDVLTGDADWWEAVQETGIPKLSIMVNNGLPRRGSMVVQPLAFSELLDKLKAEYRLILIDAASLSHAESVPMMQHCQGVYLTVRLGHSTRRAVREASRVVAKAGGKLLGCIAVGDVLESA